MRKILYLAVPLRSGTGGDRRSFEVLRRIAQYDIEPIIIVDASVYEKMNRDGSNGFLKHKIYSIKRPNVIYDRYFRSASRVALDYFSMLKTARSVADIARKENVELIVSHHEKIDYLLESYFASRTCHIPWTCIFQSFIFPPYASTPWQKIGSARKIYLKSLYEPLYYLVSQAVTTTTLMAVSPSIDLDIKSYLGGWRSKIMVLNPGVGVDTTNILRAKPNGEADAILFSRLVPEKGLYDVPKITAEIVKKKPNFRLVIVGKFGAPTFQQRFENSLVELRVKENVDYKGFRKGEELYSLIKSAKVLLYPSLQDAFPLVVLEALAAGIPIIAYDIPAISLNFPSDLVKRVPAGDYKLMAEETLKFINDHEETAKFSEKARSVVSEYDWDKVAREESRGYEVVLKNSLK